MHQATVDDVAKQRPSKPKKPKPVKAPPDAEASERKPLVLQMRGSQAWKEWLEECAKADGRSLASFMERAALVYAKQIGVTREPPDR